MVFATQTLATTSSTPEKKTVSFPNQAARPLSSRVNVSDSISRPSTSPPLSSLLSTITSPELEDQESVELDSETVLHPVPEKLSLAIKANRLIDIEPEGEIFVFAQEFFKGILDNEDINFFWSSNLVVINQTYRYASILYYG
jgi:hypothetical protein